MLIMVAKGIRGGISHAINRYTKANYKYMKTYDKNFYNGNNLYGWTMSQKLLVNGFKWGGNVSKFDEDFMKNYDEDSTKGYIFEVNFEYPRNLLNLYGDLSFLAEKKKKFNKLVCNINDKENYVAHIKTLK